MINLRKLIDLLPEYFKEHDTYKDIEDKGILERFLELVGEYIIDDSDRATSMLPNITNILDIIDIPTTRAIFLDYLYDFLGAPPQDYKAPILEAEFLHQPPYYVWYLEEDTPLQNFTQLGYIAEIASFPRKHYNPLDKRFIMYAITLYKIRGTARFYEIILKSYFNLNNITLSEEQLIMTGSTKARYDSNLTYDSNYQYDGLAMDCKSCSYFIINLTPYNNLLSPSEKDRLKQYLEKYAPINVELQVAFQLANVVVNLSGPGIPIEEDIIKVEGDGQAVVGYYRTVRISVEIPYEFVGWYDSNGNLLSISYSYTFMVNTDVILTARYTL